VILAILRAQWRSQRALGFRAKRPSAWLTLLLRVFFYCFWTSGAAGLGAMLATAHNYRTLTLLTAVCLLAITLYWQIAPVVTASLGSSLELHKLVVYPIPRDKLFVIEVLLRLTSVAEMLILSAGVTVGLAANPLTGGKAAVARVVAGMAVLIVMNALVASGLRSVLIRFLRNRHLRQAVGVLFLLLALVPQLMVAAHVDLHRYAHYVPVALFWPWGAVAHFVLGQQTAPAAGVMLLFTALGLRFGRRQFFRNLLEGEEETSSTPARGRASDNPIVDGLYRLPGRLLPDPLAAMVEKELRSLSRNPRFRMVFLMGFSFGLLVWLPRIWMSTKRSFVTDHFLTVVSVYALVMLGQVSYWNCFAFDRVATQFYFSAPLSIRKVLAGKNIAAGLFALAEVLLVLAMTSLFRVPLNAASVAEGISVTLVSAVYLVSFGNLSSVYVPRPLNAEKMTQGGSGRTLNMVLFLVFPVVLLPVGLAFWARYALDSEAAFFWCLALALGIGMILYWVALDSAAQKAVREQEKIITELSRGEGPMSTE